MSILTELKDILSRETQYPKDIFVIFENHSTNVKDIWGNCLELLHASGEIKTLSKVLAICRKEIETLDQQILDSFYSTFSTTECISLIKFISYYILFTSYNNSSTLFHQIVFDKEYWSKCSNQAWIILLGSLLCIYKTDLIPFISLDLLNHIKSILNPSLSIIWLICTKEMLPLISKDMASDHLVIPVLDLILKDPDTQLLNVIAQWMYHFLGYFPPDMQNDESRIKWLRVEHLLFKYCYSKCNDISKSSIKRVLFLYSRHVSPRALALLAQLPSSEEDEYEACLFTELVIHPIRNPISYQPPVSLTSFECNRMSCDNATIPDICLEDD